MDRHGMTLRFDKSASSNLHLGGQDRNQWPIVLKFCVESLRTNYRIGYISEFAEA